MQSTVHGVMSDDVAGFLNRAHHHSRCWSITKSMEDEIVVEAFMNFRTHTSASSSSISDLPSCFHWDLNKPLIIADKELEARECSQNQHGGFVRGGQDRGQAGG
ncbi:hypothetical protein Bca4012_065135 [Brassica carinata]|uniref:Uncharacterized protein n=1 Tax=Brassica carinata TaxID=52824 RepID=A0A8X7VNC9_BRACI|nr:hypothetical protein Bca52824_017573 [Brassica carinata]